MGELNEVKREGRAERIAHIELYAEPFFINNCAASTIFSQSIDIRNVYWLVS